MKHVEIPAENGKHFTAKTAKSPGGAVIMEGAFITGNTVFI